MVIAALALLSFTPATEPHPLFRAMKGAWSGYLEYKDYAGPGRIRIAVLARVTPLEDGKTANLRFVFDEGPDKILEDKQKLVLDELAKTYTVTSDGTDISYRIEGLDRLKPDGTGTVQLFGAGTAQDKPVDVRITVAVGAKSMSVLRETRSGSNAYAFGSVYQLTRVSPMAKR